MADGSLAERRDAHQRGASHEKPGTRGSVVVGRAADHRPARAGHPDPIALDRAVQVITATVLLEEGVEVSEERHPSSLAH